MLNFSRFPLSFDRYSLLITNLPVVLGAVAISLPTLHYIATENWSTEQGSHGPLVLASGLWLLFRMLPEAKAFASRPAAWLAFMIVIVCAAFLILFRLAAVIELEVYALYGLYIALLYAFLGWRALTRLWFPLLYLGFAVPIPESLVAFATNPLKLWISQSAVSLLHFANYSIANSGVVIYIGQYQLLVAAACAGLNSLITLSALTLFYVYLTHKSEWKYMLLLIVAVIPIAIFANFIRVLILILLTIHVGEAAAQGFLHNFAGMTTFAVSLFSIYLLDQFCQRVFSWHNRKISDQSSDSAGSNGFST